MSGRPKPGRQPEDLLAARVAEARGMLGDLQCEIRIAEQARDALRRDLAEQLGPEIQETLTKIYAEVSSRLDQQVDQQQAIIDLVNERLRALAGVQDPGAALEFLRQQIVIAVNAYLDESGMPEQMKQMVKAVRRAGGLAGE